MKLPRRDFLRLAASTAALPFAPHVASAQAYPTRPVRIVVGFVPGNPPDIFARLIGQWLSERLGQPFVVENRPGAGGTIGTEVVVRSTPDGYTLLVTSVQDVIGAMLYDKLNYNFVRDITPVATLIRQPLVMVVHPSFSAKTVPEFIAHAIANPGKVNMASAGNGMALPPGRLKLSTSPAATGSTPTAKTMGIVVVAVRAAIAAGGACVTITSTLRRTRSAAIPGSRSYWPSAQRYSIATF
jgi:hypothetical protein